MSVRADLFLRLRNLRSIDPFSGAPDLGADEGDILLVEYDLLANQATLRLADDYLLEDGSGGGLLRVDLRECL